MKALLLAGISTALLTGCYTDDREYQSGKSGDIMVEPSGAEVTPETWSEEQRDINQRPYRRQIEIERHQQFDTDPEFSHDRLD